MIRRMLEDEDGQQVFVEFNPDTGTMHVAKREREWHVWSPPLREVRNEDDK